MPRSRPLLLVLALLSKVVYVVSQIDGSGNPVPAGAYPPATQGIIGSAPAYFGFDGCDEAPFSKQFIKDAYDTMHQIASMEGIYQNVPWTEAAATEFFGPESDISSSIQKDIQSKHAISPKTQVLTAAQGVMSYINDVRSPPFFAASHNIHVSLPYSMISWPALDRNSVTDSPACRIRTVEAYSDQDDGQGYFQINFCPRFFNFVSLSDAMITGLAFTDTDDRFNLDNYENRARCVLEITHLDYFTGKKVESSAVYNPYWTKILARYVTRSTPTGTLTQASADNFAPYALAKYVKAHGLGDHPYFPTVSRSLKPVLMPQLAEPVRISSIKFDLDTDRSPIINDTEFGSWVAFDEAIPCEDNVIGNSGNNSLTVDGFLDDTQLGESYIVEKMGWLANAFTFGEMTGLNLRICL
ncbi:hypothetical protein MMC26_001640 [Xylographa opegraphella]|nr:hypothetical protein [Xylographa opegraphella]